VNFKARDALWKVLEAEHTNFHKPFVYIKNKTKDLGAIVEEIKLQNFVRVLKVLIIVINA
jgi:hypothetical protein